MSGKRRGRPAKTSREQIIEKAVALLLDAPTEPLSFHRLAKALDITPMAIYGHIADKDALLQAVATRMLDDLQPTIPNAAWEEQLRLLAQATRKHFLKYPALFAILGWQAHIASAWLRQISVLARILSQTGLSGHALADAVQWTSNTLVGGIFMEIAGRHSGYRVSAEDIQMLPAEEAAQVDEVMGHLRNKSASKVFEDNVMYVITALRQRAGNSLGD